MSPHPQCWVGTLCCRVWQGHMRLGLGSKPDTNYGLRHLGGECTLLTCIVVAMPGGGSMHGRMQRVAAWPMRDVCMHQVSPMAPASSYGCGELRCADLTRWDVLWQHMQMVLVECVCMCVLVHVHVLNRHCVTAVGLHTVNTRV